MNITSLPVVEAHLILNSFEHISKNRGTDPFQNILYLNRCGAIVLVGSSAIEY
jgi:hypothetical protein